MAGNSTEQPSSAKRYRVVQILQNGERRITASELHLDVAMRLREFLAASHAVEFVVETMPPLTRLQFRHSRGATQSRVVLPEEFRS